MYLNLRHQKRYRKHARISMWPFLLYANMVMVLLHKKLKEHEMLLDSNQKLGLFCLGLFSFFFILFMQIDLMPALIAGLIMYTLTLKLDDFLSKTIKKLKGKSKLISVSILLMIILFVFIGGFWYLFDWFVKATKNPVETMNNIKVILEDVFEALPKSIQAYLPDDINELKNQLIVYLKDHVFYLQSIAAHAFHILIIVIVGLILGLTLGFKQNRQEIKKQGVPATSFVESLNESLKRLVVVFQYIAISQVFIALFNAAMTAIFLFIILPMFGIHLPFRKSLVLATFIIGLIPIIGNLLVNTIMFFVAFTVSFGVSLVVLGYLILIHKVEYILNAKIVAGKIQAGVCELLISMLFFEVLFGVIGLVFAPIFYAFLKLSLKDLKLI